VNTDAQVAVYHGVDLEKVFLLGNGRLHFHMLTQHRILLCNKKCPLFEEANFVAL